MWLAKLDLDKNQRHEIEKNKKKPIAQKYPIHHCICTYKSRYIMLCVLERK